MKITRSRLKQIISEEMGRISEVSNDRVEIATAQSMMDDVNQTGDPKLVDEVCALLDQIVTVTSNLSDGSMRGAIIDHVQSLKGLIDEIKEDSDDMEEAEIDMPDQNMGGVEVNTPQI
jgi:hypothetical protein